VLVTEVDGDGVVVRYDDPDHSAAHVGVWAHLPLGDTTMRRVEGGWEARLSDVPVDRLEYLLDIDGDLRPDPSNPRTTGGPFGDHSWIPLPGYREPDWLGRPGIEAERVTLTLSRTGAGRVDVEIWSPAGPRRNHRYAANPAYARALTTRVVPAITEAVGTDGRPVLMGQSLGALAALHAAWTSPATFGGLFLQSGSYFTPALDPQESGFEYWHGVTGFVTSVHAASQAAPGAPPTTLTCGTAEENHANNVAMRDHLEDIGVETGWGEVRDGHTWTCWRDTLDPHLTDLLTRVWA
jgi:pimeloyl-ACP methyl ester carboxylesterase